MLLQADLTRFPHVFPKPPDRRDGAWATSVATQLSELQRELRDHGLDWAGVWGNVSATDFEPERWSQLAEMESAWREILTENGLTNPFTMVQTRLAETLPPSGVTKVVVAAVPDPAPVAIGMLARWAQTLSVEIACYGPEGESVFDEWGRPSEAAFAQRNLEFSATDSIRAVRDAKSAATLVAQLANSYRGKLRTLALAPVEAGSRGAVAVALSNTGIPTHDPSGTPLSAAGVGLLAASLLRLTQDPRAIVAAQVLRHPLVGHYAMAKGWATDQASLLAALDTVLEEHLPTDVHAAARFAAGRFDGLRKALEWLGELQRNLAKTGVADSLLRALSTIAAALPLASSEGTMESAQKVAQALREMAEVEARFPDIPSDAIGLLLLQAISRTRTFHIRDADAVDLQGWLELGYEDAPHLVVVGMNEGAVPETTRGSAFLPNSLRERLQIRGNRERFARDRYLLEAIVTSRRNVGRIDLIVPRIGTDGEPLQPSRLLFCCGDDQLIGRARALFAELPPPSSAPARRAAWQLAPLPVAKLLPTSHSPSSIKAYLACPFRYYLSHILKSDQLDTGLEEISALTFGNLCHDALETLGKDAAMQDANDARAIEEFLMTTFEKAARKQLGDVDSFALRVQLESGKARLRAAARVEAKSRQEGWRILRCESKWSMTVGDFTFGGRIDRVDQNKETGAFRLLDYKTSDAGQHPEETHWIRSKDGEDHVLPASVFEFDGKRARWSDLQLPLYLLATKAEHGGNATAGYFVLPKASADADIKPWTTLTPDHLLHAERCAIAVADAIARGRFWPPALKTRGKEPSDYMFPDGIAANVSGDLVMGLATPGGAK